jgi:predicted Zn-ribbon and HTH transcriptional regulator
MESWAMLKENINQLLNENRVNTKRVVEVFNMEFNLDDISDIENLIDLLKEHEKSLKQAKKTLLLLREKERNLVRCLECSYVHKEEQIKDIFFCLKARDFIRHELDENIECMGYKPL